MKALQPLPVGTSDFTELRARNELYIDKTAYMAAMLDGPSKYCFLARPRRFGKSLLVSTLESLFQGRTDLFQGTHACDRTPRSPNWLWPAPTPVIRLNMNEFDAEDAAMLNAGLYDRIDAYFDHFQAQRPRASDARRAATLFPYLLSALAAQAGKAAVLIDEYDHPLLHNLDHPELPRIQTLLARFYGILKSRDAQLRFVFITGITRFARTSIFSGLNNLLDISHDPAFNGLLGFTEQEVSQCLTPYMAGLMDVNRHSLSNAAVQLRERYNGYRFAPGVPDAMRVYNPFSLLTCLQTKVLDNYWAETGVPSFLPQMLLTHDCDLRDLRRLPSNAVLGGSLTAEQLARLWQRPRPAEATVLNWAGPVLSKVMFQTGYLTLTRDSETGQYVTDLPNLEVAASFVQELLPYMLRDARFAFAHLTDVCQAVLDRDPAAMQAAGNRLLATLTYLEHTPRETYYQSLLHLALLSLQYRAHVQAEVTLHRGRPDIVVAMARDVVIMELKMDDASEDPLAQAERKAYYQKYIDQGKKAYVWGVTIGRAEREILDIVQKIHSGRDLQSSAR